MCECKDVLKCTIATLRHYCSVSWCIKDRRRRCRRLVSSSLRELSIVRSNYYVWFIVVLLFIDVWQWLETAILASNFVRGMRERYSSSSLKLRKSLIAFMNERSQDTAGGMGKCVFSSAEASHKRTSSWMECEFHAYIIYQKHNHRIHWQ